MDENLKKRLKSLAWRAAMMGLAAVVAAISESITGFGFPPVVTTVLGLSLGEVSKFLNTGIK